MPDTETVESASPAPEEGAGRFVAEIAERRGVEPSDLRAPSPGALIGAAGRASREPDEAAAEEPSRPSIHERWRTRTPQRAEDPYGQIRTQIEALDRRLQEAVAPPPEEPAAPPVEQAEAYLQYHLRRALEEPLSELRAGLEELRGQARTRGEREAAQHAQDQVVGWFETLEREYESEVPGHRERFTRFLDELAKDTAAEYGIPVATARQDALEYVQGLLQRAGRLQAHPVALIDREASRYLTAKGIDLSTDSAEGAGEPASSFSPAPAARVSRTVAERARAAGSAAAGSLGSIPRAGEPQRTTAKALLRRGTDLSRKEFERAVEERLSEYGGNVHAAMAAVRSELQQAAAAAG